ncbi:hypothetical protein CU666_27935 [Pseudomonas syringae pv. actinidifoliorum]|nr:hypothetical protein [Pseudomonas syringae pv. actinidifoliorum]NAT61466.1 hypothetical protein [Pseudomonas syringae pv. actinidifoliorum]
MKDHDSATAFTLAYFELLERHLHITWSDQGIPQCVIDWITDESVTNLHRDLEKLMTGELEQAARQAAATYGHEHIQTVGFGLAPEFDQFVKLGLIYGERVVLWDTLYSRILAGDNYLRRKGLIGQIACELLMLKQTVMQGGVTLLAHPIVWSSTAAQIDADLRKNGPVPAASLGLAMAFFAIAEGIPLHPYTLLSDTSHSVLAPDVQAADHALFSRENFIFQKCLTSLLRDERVAFVQNVPTEDFHRIVTEHESLQRQLRHHFLSGLAGLSPQQQNQESSALIEDLAALFSKRDKAISTYIADAVDATAVVITASIAATVTGLPLLAALAALGAPAMALSTAVRKWTGKPEKDVIIQAFEALADSAAEHFTYDPIDVQSRIDTVKVGLQSLDDHYRMFMSLPWTEDRQSYLESLSVEIARGVLALLSADDIARIVNNRQYQHDYIGDYLSYISTLDEAIHWAHVEKSFDSPEGFLIYDGEEHISAMLSQQIPMSLWERLLESLSDEFDDQIRAADYGYPLERLPHVIRYQTEYTADKEAKRLALLTFARSLTTDGHAALMTFLLLAYRGAGPKWLLETKEGSGSSPDALDAVDTN